MSHPTPGGWPRALVAATAALAVALSVLPAAEAQGEETTIDGDVVNGTPGATLAQPVPVAIHIIRQDQTLDVRSTTTSAEGHFTFAQVPAGADIRYRLITMYQDALYSAFLGPDQASQPIRLTVYEGGADLSAVRVSKDTVLLASADRDRRVLKMLELAVLENTSLRTMNPDTSLVQIPLPKGASELVASLDQLGVDTIPVEGGIALVAALSPGSHELLLSYAVPYVGGEVVLARTFFVPTEDVRLLMPADLAQVQAPGMPQQSRVTLERREYLSFLSTGLVPGDRLEVSLKGLPQPPAMLRLGRALERGVSRSLAPTTLGLALSALIAYGLLSRRGTARSQKVVASDRATLVATLADLDGQASSQGMSQEEYQARRKAVKDRLLHLVLAEKAAEKQPQEGMLQQGD